jgi:hypothetical protein
MSNIERRRDQIQRFEESLPTSWHEEKQLRSEYHRAERRLINGGQMTKITAIVAGEIASESQPLVEFGLGELAKLGVASYFYKGIELRDDYMDGR